jgi:exonuclease III
MIRSSFNVRGLGGRVKRRKVRELVRRNKIELLAIQETKLESVDNGMCRRLWGDDKVAWSCNPALGRSGGLLTLWDGDKGKLLYSFQGQGFLGVCLEWGQKKVRVLTLNVYAPCNFEAKKQLWVELLVAKRTYTADLWCILGDFNSVRDSSERKGVAYAQNREISKALRDDQRLFNLLLENLEVEDLQLMGRKFTWIKPNGACASRLDRILVLSNWRDIWGEVSLWTLQRDVSDHCPLILKYTNWDWGPKPFHFNNHWLRHKKFKEVVCTHWSKPVEARWMGIVFKDKLKVLKLAIKKWNKENYWEADNKITALIDTIEELELKGEAGELSEVEKQVRIQCCDLLWMLLKSKDSVEFQRARSKWLKEGDANTKFFHACVKNRSRRNTIVALKKGDGWLEDPIAIKEEIVSYFAAQFSEVEWNRPTLDGLTFPMIPVSDADFICRPFDETEIKECIVNSDGNKSPGPDGFNFEFYKNCWEVVKEDFISLFNEFHSNAKLPKGLLSYFITLIPKIPNPHVIKDFRPISLLGSVYKTVAKVLAARMGTVMGNLISNNQSAFIKGRLLVDGVLTISEVVDLARRAKRKCLIFKVDFDKAYDSVNWNFLEYMLRRFGFSNKWISWMRACIFAGNLSVLINGSPTQEVSISKGLKQGDPLAPFLFLLVAEGLGTLMSRAVEFVGTKEVLT